MPLQANMGDPTGGAGGGGGLQAVVFCVTANIKLLAYFISSGTLKDGASFSLKLNLEDTSCQYQFKFKSYFQYSFTPNLNPPNLT